LEYKEAYIFAIDKKLIFIGTSILATFLGDGKVGGDRVANRVATRGMAWLSETTISMCVKKTQFPCASLHHLHICSKDSHKNHKNSPLCGKSRRGFGLWPYTAVPAGLLSNIPAPPPSYWRRRVYFWEQSGD
jgi:hypothetical protein